MEKYNEVQVARIEAAADEAGGAFGNEVAEALAAEFGKDVRSVRAKAVSMGVYRSKTREAGKGKRGDTKEVMAAQIGAIVGADMEGLEKAKADSLNAILNYLRATVDSAAAVTE